MAKLTNLQMIEQALSVVGPRKLSNDNSAGEVACALLSSSGNLYLGVCIDIQYFTKTNHCPKDPYFRGSPSYFVIY